MPGTKNRSDVIGLSVEYIMLVTIFTSIIYVSYFFITNHYLPQPFVYDVSDTFMDWFNPVVYALKPGAYDVWHSVYPPISFVFLWLFSVHSCYGDPYLARTCDWVGITTLLTFYLIDCGLAALAFRKCNRSTWIPRTFAFLAGLPMLFALERGNLVLVCLAPFIIAYGDLFGGRLTKAIAIATTINFKPYLVVPSLALLFRRDWRALELACIATIGVYLLTLAMFGSGTPFQLIENTRMFSNFVGGLFWEFSYFSTSYSSLLAIGKSPFPILAFLSSGVVQTAARVIPILIVSTQIVAFCGLLASWLQPAGVSLSRYVVLLVGGHLATQSPGAYALTFLIFPVFLEVGYRPTQLIALIAAYGLSVSYDHMIATVVDAHGTSWLSGQGVSFRFGLAVGQFVRPGLVLLIVWSLALDSIIQSVSAHLCRRPSLGLVDTVREAHA